MKHLPERHGRSLLPDGLSTASARVYRVNGVLPKNWPVSLPLADGVAEIFQDGRIAFTPHRAPDFAPGETRDQGTIQYSLWTGEGETPIYLASVTGHGAIAGAKRGWSAAWDSGLTIGEFYVDGMQGSDTNNGTTRDRPLRSVQAAVDRANPNGGDTILLRKGTYNGTVDLGRLSNAQKSTTISRYGDERPVVSGAKHLRGWAPIDPDTAAAMGVSKSSVFQIKLRAGAIDLARAESLGIAEGGTMLTLATDQIGETDPVQFGDTEYFHSADEFIIANDDIVEIRDPDVLGRYTADQMRDAIGVLWSRDNRLKRFAVGKVVTERGNAIRLREPVDKYLNDDPYYWRYALRNVLPAMKPGTWAFRRAEGGDVIVYLWPNNPSNFSDRITYAAKPNGWDIGGANGVRIQGVSFVDFGGTGPRAGAALGTFRTKSRQRKNINLSIHNCHFSRCHNPVANYGAIYVSNAQDVSVTATTIENCQNAGVMFDKTDDLSVAGCLIQRVSFSGLRHFDGHGVIFAFSDLIDVARAAHANTSHFYGLRNGPGVDRVLMYGLRVSGSGGYITWQNASRIDMGFCDIAAPVGNDSLRSVVDQNFRRNPLVVAPGKVCVFWNNLLRHNPKIPDGRLGALTLGRKGVNVIYAVLNNIIGGGGVDEAYLGEARDSRDIEVARRANIYTRLMWWQGERDGWQIGEDEVYLPHTTGFLRVPDFSLPPDSPIKQFPAFEMTSLIRDILAVRHPGFNFDVDIDGNPVDWETAGVGPYQLDWNLQIRSP